MRRDGLKAALLCVIVLLTLCGIFYSALLWLHGLWIGQMTAVIGEAGMAARGYVEGLSPWADPTFEKFARGYSIFTGMFSAMVALLIATSRFWADKQRADAQKQLAVELDGLLRGELPPAGADTLLDQKKRQVLSALEQQSREAACEREKLRALINDLSHQLKTPIASAKLHVELLKDAGLSEHEREGFLAELGGQLEKTASLSGALVHLARLEAGMIQIELRPFDLSQTIRAAIQDIAAKARAKNISLTESIAPLIVPHDPTWTKEALTNLLDNAVKYTPEGGTISVRLTPGTVYARVDIADRGIGIPEDELNRVFARFYRGKNAQLLTGEGSGLGLTIAQHILRAQNGSITAQSESGKGTRFSVFLQNR